MDEITPFQGIYFRILETEKNLISFWEEKKVTKKKIGSEWLQTSKLKLNSKGEIISEF